MLRYSLIVVSCLFVACGTPPGDGGGNSDAGPQADAGVASDAGGGGTPTICDLHAANIFVACSGCHGRNNTGGVSFDLSTPQTLHDSLVGASGNSGSPLVVGGNANDSWLWVRMDELQGEDPMPPSGKLGADARNSVRDWINGNALDDCL